MWNFGASEPIRARQNGKLGVRVQRNKLTRTLGFEEKGTTEDEMAGWHHRLTGGEFKQILGDGEGQGSLVCCSPWDCRESITTETKPL